MIKLGINNINQVYLGSNTISKAYIGSDLIFQRGGQPVSRIPYIRGGADGSYIDTGITPDSTTRIIVWARNWNPGGGFLLGSEDSSSNYYSLSATTNLNIGKISLSYGDTRASIGNFPILSGYHKYELYQGVLKVDDWVIDSNASSFAGNNFNIHLFGVNIAGLHANSAPSTLFPIDICACKIYKNDALVRDYRAVRNPAVGLYDSVSDTLFTNAGNGEFLYGKFNPDAYTQLKYVSCTGAQYIDTGVFGSNTLRSICKFKITGTNVSYASPFGTMRSGTAGSYFMLNITGPDNKNCTVNIYERATTSQRLYQDTSSPLTGREIVFSKIGTTVGLAENFSRLGSTYNDSSLSSFTTPDTLILGSTNYNQAPSPSNAIEGDIYYAAFGNKSFIPALVNNVAGLYETYSDTFYPSMTETPFVAGPKFFIPTNEAQYIETDGVAYINTEILGKSPSSAEIKLTPIRGYCTYLGATAEVSKFKLFSQIVAEGQSYNNNLSYTYNTSVAVGVSMLNSLNNYTPFVARSALASNYQALGIQEQNSSWDVVSAALAGGSNTALNLFLFANNNMGIVDSVSPTGTRVFYVKIYSDSNYNDLLFDGIACCHNGEYGIWDKISDSFFGNAANSGTFNGALIQ